MTALSAVPAGTVPVELEIIRHSTTKLVGLRTTGVALLDDAGATVGVAWTNPVTGSWEGLRPDQWQPVGPRR